MQADYDFGVLGLSMSMGWSVITDVVGFAFSFAVVYLVLRYVSTIRLRSQKRMAYFIAFIGFLNSIFFLYSSCRVLGLAGGPMASVFQAIKGISHAVSMAGVLGCVFLIKDLQSKEINPILDKAVYDDLTSLMRKEYFEALLNRNFILSHERKKPLSIIFADIDHFKVYNDTFGHVAGDVALKSVASVLAGSLRSGDIVSRWGGEEFVVLLYANSDLALDVANRIRSKVESECNNIVDPKIKTGITISLGVSSINSYDTSPESILKRADAALYRSKKDGRNRVSFL